MLLDRNISSFGTNAVLMFSIALHYIHQGDYVLTRICLLVCLFVDWFNGQQD